MAIMITSLEHPVEWARDFISINYYRLIHLYFIHVKKIVVVAIVAVDFRGPLTQITYVGSHLIC